VERQAVTAVDHAAVDQSMRLFSGLSDVAHETASDANLTARISCVRVLRLTRSQLRQPDA
jgi:hypothetical protein